MAEPPGRRAAGRFVVRRFEKGDRDAFLALYERARGRTRMPEWFEWRFEHNPCLSHVPVFLVESADGRLVAGGAFDAFRMWTPEGEVLALRPATVLVDPARDPERPLARLAEACTEFYAGRRPRFCFGVADGKERTGIPDLTYRTVGGVPTYYRVQDPTAFMDGRRRTTRRLAGLAADYYLGARIRTLSVDEDTTVGRYTELPIGVLSSLYRRAVPDGLHAERDPTFYRWRFSDPEHPATTYVAFDGDEPVAAIVTYVDDAGDVRRVRLADIVPMRETPGRDAAVRALLLAIVDEHGDADALVATGSAFPTATLRAVGFHAVDRRPLSAVASSATLAVAPFPGGDGDDWVLSGLRLDVGRNWSVTDAVRGGG